jgi:hypothetical protein
MSRAPKPPSKRVASPDALTVVPGREVTYHNEPQLPKKSGTVKTSVHQPAAPIARRPAHQRIIRISVLLPASVELLVGTNEDVPSEDADWEILAVREAGCEATIQLVQENMRSTEFAELAVLAARAKDVE